MIMVRRPSGLGSIFELPDGRWRAQIRAGYLPSGAARYVTATRPDQTAATKALRDLLRKQAAGELPTGPTTTVKAWADAWIVTQQRRLRPQTSADYASKVRHWVIPTIGKRRLAALTPADIRAVTDAVRAAGDSSTTAAHVQTVTEKMLRDAIQEGHAVPARVLAVERPAHAVNDRTAIPVDQAVALLRTAAGDPDVSQWAAALLAGLRQGERLGLTWGCVDLAAGSLDISWQLQPLKHRNGRSGDLIIPDGYEYRRLDGSLCLVRPKSKAGYRVIPLVPWLASSLELWRSIAPYSPHGLVWPRADGRPQTRHGDTDAWRTLQDRADVVRHPSGRYWQVHEMRHTAATLLMALGVDETVRTAILGHSSIVTSRAYQHASVTQARAALEAAAGALQLGV